MVTVNFAPIHDYRRVVRRVLEGGVYGVVSSNERLVRAELDIPNPLFIPAASGTIPALIRLASR